MSSSPFPYTCELCGAEGLTDEGMRTHTLEAHMAGRPDCPFCDCTVPQTQLVGHVQRAHLHYLTPERELMAFIDDQSPSFDEDSRMTTDSCSYNTPGSINGWHSPDHSSTSVHNGAISKNNINYCQNGFRDRDSFKDCSGSLGSDHEEISRSPKNINLNYGPRNININNGVVPKTPKKVKSRENSNETKALVNGEEKRGTQSSQANNYEGSPSKNKMCMTGAGQGSPLRSQLALKLKPNTPKKSASSPTVQCLLCEFTSNCPQKLEEHINRAHFDLTSPSVVENPNSNSNLTTATATDNPTIGLTNAMAISPTAHGSNYQCPICDKTFVSGSDIELHVNVDHKDILSPQKNEQLDNASSSDEVMMMEESPVSDCPICCQPLPLSQHELIRHIEEHFERGEDGAGCAESSRSHADLEAQRSREEQEFQLLRAQYGMEEEEDGGYTGRTASGLRRAVYSGALSVAGYYERSIGLKKASAAGRDDGSSRTTGLLEKIAQLNTQNSSIIKTYLCSGVDHYASTYGDRGWGCGYRNMQMVLSSLVRNEKYAALLRAAWEGDDPRSPAVPSIPKLQLLVERAWQMGFDTQGSEQLGCKLHNTRKWIGACEVVTVLSSLRIRCQLIDFHKPTGADGSHPALFDWVLRYFRDDPDAFKPPLYLQHQGHSRTIIGYEKHKDGKATLLVLDPSHAPAQVRQVVCGSTSSCSGALRLLRRGSAALRARQYQLLAVTGTIDDEEEYQKPKVLTFSFRQVKYFSRCAFHRAGERCAGVDYATAARCRRSSHNTTFERHPVLNCLNCKRERGRRIAAPRDKFEFCPALGLCDALLLKNLVIYLQMTLDVVSDVNVTDNVKVQRPHAAVQRRRLKTALRDWQRRTEGCGITHNHQLLLSSETSTRNDVCPDVRARSGCAPANIDFGCVRRSLPRLARSAECVACSIVLAPQRASQAHLIRDGEIHRGPWVPLHIYSKIINIACNFLTIRT
ncbi:Zinc finger with UFM1-specific peptidase domain protein [Eumeta japonica]|uniref:Zinc finger-containing ubiquitin peptidase 1 n=1 Tax=Eumeta variegata TaxID=151549 RepID=A0A4C1YVX4_EUMVA|nr:Zinc finger with UFM1-specific peptidase domain protein [Eumeta japonica]